MAHVRQEFALGPRGIFGALLRDLEVRDQPCRASASALRRSDDIADHDEVGDPTVVMHHAGAQFHRDLRTVPPRREVSSMACGSAAFRPPQRALFPLLAVARTRAVRERRRRASALVIPPTMDAKRELTRTMAPFLTITMPSLARSTTVRYFSSLSRRASVRERTCLFEDRAP